MALDSVTQPATLVLTQDLSLGAALDVFLKARANSLPVIGGEWRNNLLGEISRQDVLLAMQDRMLPEPDRPHRYTGPVRGPIIHGVLASAGALLLLSGMASVRAAPVCDRACLYQVLDRYLAALKAAMRPGPVLHRLRAPVRTM